MRAAPVRPRRRAVRLGRLALAALTALVVVAMGCSPKKITGPDQAPQTTLFIQFDGTDTTHTVNHVVHLYWFGSDADGFVTGYDIRFIDPGGPADPPWTRTTATDSVFTIQAPSGIATPTFQVRAIDDAGNVDASPAVQAMRFDNQPPTIALIDPPAANESTYAAVTMSWIAGDIDGDPSRLQYRVWLNGNQANPQITTHTTLTIPTSAFVEGGKLRPGRRRVFVQAIDDGGRLSDPDSTDWYVRAPVPDSTRWFWPAPLGQHPRLLIVDDHPSASNVADNGRYDSLFTNAGNRALPAGSFEILRLENTQPFQSADDLRQTLALYDGVVWYRGQQRGFTSNTASTAAMMRRLASGFTGYVDQGGKLFIEALDPIEGEGATGIFPETMLSTYYNSSRLYKRFNPAPPPDSLVDWGVAPGFSGVAAQYASTVLNVVLRANNALGGGARGFAVRDTDQVLLWARDSVLSQRQQFDAPVGVTVGRPGGGRFLSLSVPLVVLRGQLVNYYLWVDKLYQHMGLVGP